MEKEDIIKIIVDPTTSTDQKAQAIYDYIKAQRVRKLTMLGLLLFALLLTFVMMAIH